MLALLYIIMGVGFLGGSNRATGHQIKGFVGLIIIILWPLWLLGLGVATISDEYF